MNLMNLIKPMKPMLARDWIESKVKFPCIIQPKIDGVRALCIDGKLVGRSLKPFANKYVTQMLSRPEFNGFDGEMFLLGIAEHFRNLLICKDEKTSTLLEVADDVKENYVKQAGLTNETFLLNALNIINQCDIDYKTAKNKRLLVELALLKICFLNTQIENTLSVILGEKKN